MSARAQDPKLVVERDQDPAERLENGFEIRPSGSSNMRRRFLHGPSVRVVFPGKRIRAGGCRAGPRRRGAARTRRATETPSSSPPRTPGRPASDGNPRTCAPSFPSCAARAAPAAGARPRPPLPLAPRSPGSSRAPPGRSGRPRGRRASGGAQPNPSERSTHAPGRLLRGREVPLLFPASYVVWHVVQVGAHAA